MKDKKVQFMDTVQYFDGSIDKLRSYKVVMECNKQVLFLYCFYVECWIKELMFVQLSNC